MEHLPRNLTCRTQQHFKSSWAQLTALLMVSKSHVRVIWGAPALFFLFNWAAFSNFGMNNVRPSVNVQRYTKKQTQSLPHWQQWVLRVPRVQMVPKICPLISWKKYVRVLRVLWERDWFSISWTRAHPAWAISEHWIILEAQHASTPHYCGSNLTGTLHILMALFNTWETGVP